MKFKGIELKEGMKVKIRDDLENLVEYNGRKRYDDMKGGIGIIDEITAGYFTIDNCGYGYTSEMIESIIEEPKEETKEEIKEEYTRGERIEVLDELSNGNYIYLATVEGADYPYIVVDKASEKKFLGGEEFEFTYMSQIRKIKQDNKIDKIEKINNPTNTKFKSKINEVIEVVNDLYSKINKDE